MIREWGQAVGWMDALGLGPREHVAVVGGGGKTSLCFALAHEMLAAGKRVVTTTTTKVWQREAHVAPGVVFSPCGVPDLHRLNQDLGTKKHIFIGRRPLDSGKVEGLAPEVADLLFRNLDVDYVIAEADGAAGRPVKAPAGQEPVIAASTTVVIAVMGLEALGRRLDPQRVFRLKEVMKVTGLREGDMLTPGGLAVLFWSPDGLFKGTPRSAKKMALLNKSDRLGPDQDVKDLVYRILESPHSQIERIIAGSLARGACRVWMHDGQDAGMPRRHCESDQNPG